MCVAEVVGGEGVAGAERKVVRKRGARGEIA